jgi:hypothetical protein
MKIRPVGAELFHANRRTDRHDDVNSRFLEILRKRLKRNLNESISKYPALNGVG